MNTWLKPFSFAKFVSHGCGPQVCRDSLRIVCQKFRPVYAVTQTNWFMLESSWSTNLILANVRKFWRTSSSHICWRHIRGKTDIGWIGHGRWWFRGFLLQSQQQHQPQWSPWQHAAERDFSWERAIILHSPHRGYVNWCASGHELGPKGTRISSSAVRFLPSGLAVRQLYEVPKCNVV